MELVSNMVGFRDEEVASVYVLLAGKKTSQTLKLTNKLITEWQMSIKMDKPDKDSGCPYPQVSSSNSNRGLSSQASKISICGRWDQKISGIPWSYAW